MNSILGFFVSGPKASATVYNEDHIEPIINTLCELTGDDPDDYTATDLDAPTSIRADFQKLCDNLFDNVEGIFREADELFKKADAPFRK
jgi:hypothetical protein